MIAYTITIGALSYSGIYHSRCAAVLDALQRYPGARGISVKVAQYV